MTYLGVIRSFDLARGNGAQGINFNGGVGSISYNPSSWIGLVGEFGGYHNGNVQGSGASVNTVSYLFGPKSFMSSGKIEPFAQVLFGGSHASCSNCGGQASANAFTMALGGGLDYKFAPHIAIRVGQIDYVMTRFSIASGFGNNANQNNFRYSAGVVFKF